MINLKEQPSLKNEIIGGITTFFTMAYIIVVNPSILSTEGTGMAFSGVMTATVLLAFLMTLLMGVYAKLPFAVAPGMGINAFFTFSLILGQKIPWPVALGMVFWAGVIFVLISLTPFRESIAHAIPKQLRVASAAGIGVFLTFIGLKNSGLIVSDPATFVRIGHIGQESIFAIIGLVVMIFLHQKKNPIAILGGIGAASVLALLSRKIHLPESFFSRPDFTSVFFELRPLDALKLSFAPAIISILFTDLFDSISTFVGVAHSANLLDEKGEPRHLRQGLLVDAIATLTAGLFGTSSGTAFIESAAGIEAGARTGLASVITALCFLPCFFIAPIVGMIPSFATAPALIFVGALMFKCVQEFELDKIEDLIPAFLTLVLIPLTFSITQGMLFGFISHTLLYILMGRGRDVSKMMYLITIISAALIVIENI